MRRGGPLAARVLLLGLALALPIGEARAEVRREGAWPGDDQELVSLSIEGVSRAEAIRRLADAADWSVVVHGALAGTVDVQVKDQPAGRVLELILTGEPYVAQREGKMVAIAPARPSARPAGGALPEPPPLPTQPDVRARPVGQRGRGEDRVVTGSNVTIARDEVVDNLTVLGGSAEVFGTVSGDLAVFGGSVQLHDSAHVHGDLTTMGGSVDVADGAVVDGDISTLGGHVDRQRPGDDATATPGDWDDCEADDCAEDAEDDGGFLARAGRAVARSALLFAFGAVLLALASLRMERLQGEIVTRPGRTLALGVVGLLGGLLALLAVSVTIIGIPIAFVAVLVGALGVYAGMCAALTALGGALLGTRSPSPYLHLALGCVLYLLASSIPGLGWVVTLAAVSIGCGALLGTRAAGLVPRRATVASEVAMPRVSDEP